MSTVIQDTATQVFSVTGNKISSLIFGDESFRFSSSTFTSRQEFEEAWTKKLSLATKVEIKYDAIKLVKKEDNDKDIKISYKGWSGVSSGCEFSFQDPAQVEVFFAFLEKSKFFTKTHEKLSPFGAIKNYLIGLVATVGITIFAYFQAVAMANGTDEYSGGRKGRLFKYIIGLLGDKGVLAVGILIAGFLAYKIWQRYSNPPHQLVLTPPHGNG